MTHDNIVDLMPYLGQKRQEEDKIMLNFATSSIDNTIKPQDEGFFKKIYHTFQAYLGKREPDKPSFSQETQKMLDIAGKTMIRYEAAISALDVLLEQDITGENEFLGKYRTKLGKVKDIGNIYVLILKADQRCRFLEDRMYQLAANHNTHNQSRAIDVYMLQITDPEKVLEWVVDETGKRYKEPHPATPFSLP